MSETGLVINNTKVFVVSHSISIRVKYQASESRSVNHFYSCTYSFPFEFEREVCQGSFRQLELRESDRGLE
jgi:hypothetical protein